MLNKLFKDNYLYFEMLLFMYIVVDLFFVFFIILESVFF